MNFDDCFRLIKKGDVVSLRDALETHAIDPNLANQFSWILLMLAALEGNLIMGNLLLSRGAAPDATNDFGETALSLAEHKGHVPFVRMLLGTGASPDTHPRKCTLGNWLRAGSGLPDAKVMLIVEMVNAAKLNRETVVAR